MIKNIKTILIAIFLLLFFSGNVNAYTVGDSPTMLPPAYSSYAPNSAAADQGVTSTAYVTLKNLVDAIGATDQATIILSHSGATAQTTYTLTTNESVPANITLWMEPGAILDGAGTLTINGPFKPGLCQVFGSSITITFGSGAIRESCLEWWYDGGGDWASAIQAAVTEAAGHNGRRILIPEDGINIESKITLSTTQRNIIFQGIGRIASLIKWTGAADGTMFQVGSAGVHPEYIEFRNLFFDGNDSAKYCIENYGRRITIDSCRLTNVNNGVALKFHDDTYYVYLNEVEFRNDGAHNSTAIQTSASANAFFFNNVTISNWQNYGLYISGTLNMFEFKSGTIEGCGKQAVYVTAIGQVLNIHDVYIENCAGAGEGMIETTASVKSLSLSNLYLNPGIATEYAVKVVNTKVEVENIYTTAGFGTSIFNLDANSRLIKKGIIEGADTWISGAGIANMDEVNMKEWRIAQSPNSTVLKNGGTWYVDLDLHYSPCIIELTILGRFESSATGISNKWAVFGYPLSTDTVNDIETTAIYSLGDATKADLTMVASDPGASYKIRFTFTNANVTLDFSLYEIFWNIKWSRTESYMKAPIPE